MFTLNVFLHLRNKFHCPVPWHDFWKLSFIPTVGLIRYFFFHFMIGIFWNFFLRPCVVRFVSYETFCRLRWNVFGVLKEIKLKRWQILNEKLRNIYLTNINISRDLIKSGFKTGKCWRDQRTQFNIPNKDSVPKQGVMGMELPKKAFALELPRMVRTK